MSLISEKFADELREKDMRDAYIAAQTCAKLVEQIRAIRASRGWSQAEFAKRLGKPQSNVSQRLENREYSGFTLTTLLEVASAFDVALVAEFVPYVDFLKRTNDLSKRALEVDGFDRASLEPICRAAPVETVSGRLYAGTVLSSLNGEPAQVQVAGGITASGAPSALRVGIADSFVGAVQEGAGHASITETKGYAPAAAASGTISVLEQNIFQSINSLGLQRSNSPLFGVAA